jgi:TolA-binding protein
MTVSPPKASPPQTGVSSSSVVAFPTTVTGIDSASIPQDAHLNRLREKREKLRLEIARLQKLQRLEEIEAEVQKEIEMREAELAGGELRGVESNGTGDQESRHPSPEGDGE